MIIEWFRNSRQPTYFLNSPVNRFKRNRLRRAIRGCRKLKAEGNLKAANLISEDFARSKILNSNQFSKLIFGTAYDNSEFVVRQFVMSRFAGWRLTFSILASVGGGDDSLVYPMPSTWRDIAEGNGVKIDKIPSRIVWHFYVFLFFLKGIYFINKTIFRGIASLFGEPVRLPKIYASFQGMSPSNLPRKSDPFARGDIVSWYRSWTGSPKNLLGICHDVKGADQQSFVDNTGLHYLEIDRLINPRVAQIARFLGWALLATSVCVADLVRGRWWHPIILQEAARSAVIRINGKAATGKEYLFHNSEPVYRPMWTYEAAKYDALITMYFYSANCERFGVRKARPESKYYGYLAMNWPRILVWDEYQAQYFRRDSMPSQEIIVVGPITFSSGNIEGLTLPEGSISVFDVQPQRVSYYATQAIEFDYYTPQNAKAFIEDIESVLCNAGITMVFKRKRNIGRQAYGQYRLKIRELSLLQNVILADPSVDAMSIILNTVAVISMPFTSTAILGKSLGKPSVYYDPLGLLLPDDPAAHGIKIIKGKEKLREWVEKTLRHDAC